MDHCLARAMLAPDTAAGICRDVCRRGDFALLDSAGESHAVRTDQYCRNHVFFARDLCLLDGVPQLAAAGVRRLRVEGQHYSPEYLVRIVAAYRRRLNGAAPTTASDLAAAAPRPLGAGVFRHAKSR